MNDNDMNEMFKKAQYMIQNNQIPDDIKKIINNFQNSSNIKTSNNSNQNFNNKNDSNFSSNQNLNSKNNLNFNSNQSFNNQNNTSSNSQNNNSMPNIDIDTLMKMQNIMSKMKNSENDDMSKLLLSLKPYLRDGKKDKIDEYIQLIKMGKMTQLFETFGGDKN